MLTGGAQGIVVATGLDTQVGLIHTSAQQEAPEIPIQKELNRLSFWIVIFILGVCITLLIAGLITGKLFRELLVTLTALFICVIPEGLPVVLTLILASGVYRMAKLKVLVKRMQAIETLGRVDVIVMDKTGTLTRNQMMASDLYVDNSHFTVTGSGYNCKGAFYRDGTQVTEFSSQFIEFCARLHPFK